MGSMGFRNPPALSSALASLGMLQPRAVGFLNPVDLLVSASNLYVAIINTITLQWCMCPLQRVSKMTYIIYSILNYNRDSSEDLLTKFIKAKHHAQSVVSLLTR